MPVNDQKLYPVMSDASLFINGQSTLGFLETTSSNSIHTANYYKYIQTLSHKLSSPVRNIYTYSFALNPKDPSPTGSLNFSTVESSKSFIRASIINIPRFESDQTRTFNMNLYFLGYQTLVFENGFMSLKYATF